MKGPNPNQGSRGGLNKRLIMRLREQVLLWSLALRNELPTRRPVQVQPLVWVGGVPTPRRWRALQDAGVSRALSVLAELKPPGWLSDPDNLLWLRVRDRLAPTLTQLEDGADFIDNAIASGAGVLVFCGSGIGRAPTAYVAWRMRVCGSSPESALNEVVRLRSIANPTHEQQRQLQAWGRSLRP